MSKESLIRHMTAGNFQQSVWQLRFLASAIEAENNLTSFIIQSVVSYYLSIRYDS